MTPSNKYVPPFEALEKLRNYCAGQERSQKAVREKLYTWGLKPVEIDSIVAELITEGFLNEQRFADAFVSGRFRIKGWGRTKITMHMRQLNISKPCMQGALAKIDEDEYMEKLNTWVKKRAAKERGGNAFQKRGKVARFVIGKGFEPDLVWEAVQEHMPD